jgi:hypothetical protein
MDTARRAQYSAEHVEYILPARRLTGTRADVLAEIDELVQGLVGLRQLVSLHYPEPPSDAPERRLRLVPALLAALFVSAALLWARPSTAQTLDVSAALQTPAGNAAVQQPTDPNPGALTITGGVDFLNQYMFRGIRQNSTGVATWPWADLGVAAYSGDGGLKGVTVNLGTWNSLHTGDTGSDGSTSKRWYESDFYATVGFGVGGGVSFATTYTAYTSPNSSFSTVKEMMFKLALDDSTHLGKGAVKPYVVVARELDTAAGLGQADGGARAGTYLELGIAPGFTGSKASVAVPVKLGLSLGNYYELAGTDNTFGFFSVAGIVTAPLGGTTKYGAWNIHGGAEFQKLGDATAFFNGGHHSQVIGSVGLGFSY